MAASAASPATSTSATSAASASSAAPSSGRGSAWRNVLRVAADTALLGLAAAWGAWGSPFGLWVWTALSLTWMADVLTATRTVRLWLAGLGAVLAARVALALGFTTLRPTPGVAAVALAVLLAAVVLVALRPALRAVPVRLRRPLVAFLGAEVVLAAAAAGAAHATGRWVLLAAALLLCAGDLLGMRQRFVQRSWRNEVLGLPMQYGALLLLLY